MWVFFCFFFFRIEFQVAWQRVEVMWAFFFTIPGVMMVVRAPSIYLLKKTLV